jgi:hypothetical protein
MEIPIVALQLVSNPTSIPLDIAQKAMYGLCEPFDPWVAVPLAFIVDFPAYFLFYRRLSMYMPNPLWSSFVQSVVFATAIVAAALISRSSRPIVAAKPVRAASKQKAN